MKEILAVGAVMLAAVVTGRRNKSRKTCPDCAEAVRREAVVCKHCGYRFA